ncbi:MAG: hypothetical protein FWD68_04810 [Alphaproteobacteria bacterium]|nr:hypothetical protein [Alphaproteobacteria bacterium]
MPEIESATFPQLPAWRYSGRRVKSKSSEGAGSVYISKVANAFYLDASISMTGLATLAACVGLAVAGGFAAFGLGGAIACVVVSALGVVLAKHVCGGLWVGGRAEITDRGVRFEANGLNRIFHSNAEPVWVAADCIRAVELRPGWFTEIVAVAHSEGTFPFRCYGASEVVATMAKKLRDR